MLTRTKKWLSLLPAVALVLAGVSCKDQLPTEAESSINSPRLSVSGDGELLSTDKDDYAPGETVVIGGKGWEAGETVRLQVVHFGDTGNNEEPEHQPWDVTADPDGNISATWLVPLDGDEAGATLSMTADGQSSGIHAELIFTDLIGNLALFVDDPEVTSQTAYPWGATIYPRFTGAGSGNCYRIQWLDPSSNVIQTNTFGPGLTSYNDDTSPALPTFTVPATGPSGVWSILVDQNTSGNCAGPFISPGNPILFDVARAVVIGAGTVASDATFGDTYVQQNTPTTVTGATATTMFVQSQLNANRRVFLQFDLSPLALPATAVVSDAKVRLMVATTPASSRTNDIQRADASWNEGAITWNTQPGVTGAVNSATVPSVITPPAGTDNQTWVRWTVTADVQGFVNASFTNNGWRIIDNAENNTPSAVASRYFTTEGTTCTIGTVCRRQVPVLLIDYTTSVADNTGTVTAIHSGDPTTDVSASGVTSVALGSTVHDKATVSNTGGGSGHGTPEGTVAFTFWTDGTCGLGGGTSSSAGASVAVNASGIAHPSTSKGPLVAGSYSFKASFTSSDLTKWASSTSDCEPLTVNTAATTTTTQVHNASHQDVTDEQVAKGSFIHDNAAVGTQVGSIAITGTVTFEFFNNRTCSGAPASTETVSVGTESTPQQMNTLGSFSYLATYNGDTNYDASADSACEPFDVVVFGMSQGFWSNKNGNATIIGAGGYAANPVSIGRGSNINTQAEATKVLPRVNACGKGSPQIFTVGGSTNSANCALATGINFNSLNVLASQTLALGYNIRLITSYGGQSIGILGCSALATAGLTSSSTVDDAFIAAVALIDGSSTGGTTTQSQVGAMNALLSCLNSKS